MLNSEEAVTVSSHNILNQDNLKRFGNRILQRNKREAQGSREFITVIQYLGTEAQAEVEHLRIWVEWVQPTSRRLIIDGSHGFSGVGIPTTNHSVFFKYGSYAPLVSQPFN